MKKLLVSSLLGSILAVSTTFGEDTFVPNVDTLLKSRFCNEKANAKSPICKELKSSWDDMTLDMTTGDEYQGLMMFLDNLKKDDKKAFATLLNKVKDSNVGVEYFLLIDNYDGNSIIKDIVKNNKIDQAQGIVEVFGSLKDNAKIQKELKDVKISDKMKSILF